MDEKADMLYNAVPGNGKKSRASLRNGSGGRKDDTMKNMKKYLAECFGTMMLVIVACGTASAVGCSTQNADAAYLITALAFGMTLTAMIYVIGPVSGCHINPAVSIGVLLSGKMSVGEFGGYVVSQFAGGLLGAGVLRLVLGGESSLGANGVADGTLGACFAVEAILTCLFVLVILSVTADQEYSRPAGMIIGGTLTLVHLIGIHFTGCSVNPARFFGPALLAGAVNGATLLACLCAPLVGGAAAALLFRAFRAEK